MIAVLWDIACLTCVYTLSKMRYWRTAAHVSWSIEVMVCHGPEPDCRKPTGSPLTNGEIMQGDRLEFNTLMAVTIIFLWIHKYINTFYFYNAFLYNSAEVFLWIKNIHYNIMHYNEHCIPDFLQPRWIM